MMQTRRAFIGLAVALLVALATRRREHDWHVVRYVNEDWRVEQCRRCGLRVTAAYFTPHTNAWVRTAEARGRCRASWRVQ